MCKIVRVSYTVESIEIEGFQRTNSRFITQIQFIRIRLMRTNKYASKCSYLLIHDRNTAGGVEFTKFVS